MKQTDTKLQPWEGTSRPAAVFIELTSHCNMKCKFCPSEILSRKRSHMRPETVFRILEECRGKGVPVTFHVLGEPLLNPHFFEYAEFCDKTDIKYELTTNATLCTEELAEKLFCLKNLTNVYVSFHTLDAESFKLRGIAMDFEAYMRNVENLIFSQKRYENGKMLEILVMYDAHDKRLWGSFTEERWLAFTAQVKQWQERLMERFPDAWERFPFFFAKGRKLTKGADFTRCKGIENIPDGFFTDLPEKCMYLLCHIFPNIFINIKKFFMFGQSSRYLKHAFDRQDIAILPARNFRCSLSNILGILSNGDITFCCLDYEGRLSCGNIDDMTLTEALSSARRKTLVEHPDNFAVCRECKGTWA